MALNEPVNTRQTLFILIWNQHIEYNNLLFSLLIILIINENYTEACSTRSNIYEPFYENS